MESPPSPMIDTDDHECSLTQFVDARGVFKTHALEKFTSDVRLAERGISYVVVSIFGLQSSGKSTLLNALFGTKFRVMDPSRGRSQTTEGIWITKAAGIEPCTLVMDLEGMDGNDDTSFENQSALFALAVSDIVLINIWCRFVGLEKAGSRALLKTVFQAITQSFTARKTTLVFVLRDKTSRTPFECLEAALREDVSKIWDSIPKSEQHKETPVSHFFNVEVVALSHYEKREHQFKDEVGALRGRFLDSIAPGGLAGDRSGAVPGSGFCLSAQRIWMVIKENKDLDLPTHKVIVARIRCEDIADEQFSSLTKNEDWLSMEEAARLGAVPGFGKKLSSILEGYLARYESQTVHFDGNVRSKKRKQLEEWSLQLVQPAFQAVLGHILYGCLGEFKERFGKALEGGEWFSAAARDCTRSYMALFDERCADVVIEKAKWDTSSVREKLRSRIDAHVRSVRDTKVSELMEAHKARLEEALSGPVEAFLKGANSETWSAIRTLLLHQTMLAISQFSSDVSSYEMDEQMKEEMLDVLRDYGRLVVRKRTNEVSRNVLELMKECFATLFSCDVDYADRVWRSREDVRDIARQARSASLRLLSVMAAIRLDGEKDNIEQLLLVRLLDNKPYATDGSIDHLALSTWEDIPSSETLITPQECKTLWVQFIAETQHTIDRAVKEVITVQEEKSHKRWWKVGPALGLVLLGLCGWRKCL